MSEPTKESCASTSTSSTAHRRTPARKSSRPSTSNTPPRCSHPKHLARCTADGRARDGQLASCTVPRPAIDDPRDSRRGRHCRVARALPRHESRQARRRVFAPPTGRPFSAGTEPLVEAGNETRRWKVHVPVGRYHRRTAPAGHSRCRGVGQGPGRGHPVQLPR
jgi:hypothetical protein